MAYVFVLFFLELLEVDVVVVLGIWRAAWPAVLFALSWRYRASL